MQLHQRQPQACTHAPSARSSNSEDSDCNLRSVGKQLCDDCCFCCLYCIAQTICKRYCCCSSRCRLGQPCGYIVIATHQRSCAMIRLDNDAVLLSAAAASGSSHSAVLNSGSFCRSMVANRCCRGRMLSSSLMKLSPVACFRHLCNTTQCNRSTAAEDPTHAKISCTHIVTGRFVRALMKILCFRKQQQYWEGQPQAATAPASATCVLYLVCDFHRQQAAAQQLIICHDI